MVALIAAFVFGALSLLGLYILVMNARAYLYFADNRSIQDFSQQGHTIPDNVMTTWIDLQGLGFQRLGELGVEVKERDRWIVEWVLVNQDQTITAEVVVALDKRTSVLFGTLFENGAMVETSLASRTSIQTPTYRLTGGSSNIAESLATHQHAVDEFSHHGPPKKITTMSDMLAREQIFQQNYAKLRLRPLIKTNAVQFIWLAWATLVAAIYAADVLNDTLNTIMLLSVVVLMGLLFIVSRYVVS
jgi:hypothetical protein